MFGHVTVAQNVQYADATVLLIFVRVAAAIPCHITVYACPEIPIAWKSTSSTWYCRITTTLECRTLRQTKDGKKRMVCTKDYPDLSTLSLLRSATSKKAIAVLHPRKLGVYTVDAVGGRGAKASFYNLVKAYEHVLGIEGAGYFTSFNMTHGGFGGVPHDLLCVQSMDGRLQVDITSRGGS